MKTLIIRMPTVMARTGLSRAMIYLLVARGDFPRQVQIGPRAVGWVEDEIESWIEERVRRRNQQAA
ncbi:MAG TPA: AlpA family transcriptional regulator [Nevskia sp.]|nr:AlpA family transcriptional regulator [Nevskia sp.]